jgi:glycosyltransferase involved in cell wall biosynthesis
MLRKTAHEMSIADIVSFLGVRTDVSDLINAFDIVLFPSLYEGLPIVTIEAQANGLPIVCSNAVPESCVLSPNMNRLSLELGPEEWANALLSADLTRADNRQAPADAGFDIRQEAEKLQKFYLDCAGVN